MWSPDGAERQPERRLTGSRPAIDASRYASLQAASNRELLFTGNVLVDVVSDHNQCKNSLVADNLVCQPRTGK